MTEEQRLKRNAYMRVYNKIYRKRNPERTKSYQVKYNKNNPDAKKLSSDKYYKNNKEKCLSYCKKYREENPEKRKATCRNWWTNNRDRGRLIVQNRRQKMLGKITRKEWRELVEVFNGHCAYCGIKPEGILHMGHVIPIKSGGKHHIDNILPACPKCNQRKNALTFLMFLTKLWRKAS